ncbi:winged helix-turn-helix transcriptional regulator [Agrococcus sp. SGAir0287]|uniref:winged helix-turn-helix transcriptional regulator n=1 Tax=Agrococcus sp. SGAir0287 TaxID=2070347 RepID=UPI0010CD0488|nr:helix-turn-helix domain-containing protein [Agrococcus sp. SGAir0287]QCR19010.1 transcriptional regulator [Agrococcus sp. SGAir0287]
MTEPAHDPVVCDAAITSAFAVLGKRWNGMLLRVLGFGTESFAELRRAVPGISDTMLADRLAELAATGLVVRVVEPGPPVAVRYGLTDAGQRLMPVLDDLGRWASESLAVGAQPADAR